MAPRKKTKTLKYAVDMQPVRFAIGVGILVLEPKDHTIVQVDGKFAKQHHQGLTLEREGTLREFPFTRAYDPNKVDDYEIIRRVEKHLEDNPGLANAPISLAIVPQHTPVPPDSAWDTMSATAIKQLVEITGKDLFACMNYEISKGEDCRDDVVEILEKLNEDRARKEALNADEVVAL